VWQHRRRRLLTRRADKQRVEAARAHELAGTLVVFATEDDLFEADAGRFEQRGSLAQQTLGRGGPFGRPARFFVDRHQQRHTQRVGA
jgi:hypothetical protein